ncbi:MAG TPA: hypothetical protein ACFYD3_05095 [Candidatus Hypogeohydataceae bacterium YC41]
MQGKMVLLFILFGFCIGCTSEESVKEYVKRETTGLQEDLNSTVKSQEELKNKQAALEGQIKDVRVSLETMNRKLAVFQDSVEGEKKEPSIKIGQEELINLRSELEKKVKQVEDMENKLTYLKESMYTTKDTELTSLTNKIDDTKRFVDMNLAEAFKAQERLKNYIIDEVAALKQEYKNYAKELNDTKSRLEAIELTMGKKKPPEM